MKRGKTLWKTLVSASAVLALTAGSVTAALAEDSTSDTSTVTNDTGILPGDTSFYKEYKLVTAITTDITSPAETFSFTSGTLTEITNSDYKYNDIKDAPIPDKVRTISIGTDSTGQNNVKFDAGAATDSGATAKISIRADINNYTSPGVYFYDFHENAGGTAGVVYNSDTYRLMLPVVYGTDNKTLKFDTDNVHIIKGTSDTSGKVTYPYVSNTTKYQNKTNSVTNEYRAGALRVEKFVTGNVGNKETTFKVTVTLTAPEGRTVKSDITLRVTNAPSTNSVSFGGNVMRPETDGSYKLSAGNNGWETTTKTVTFYVKDGSVYELKNIPAGVTYVVSEDTGGYAPTFSDGNVSLSTTTSENGVATMTTAKTMDATLQEVKISNRKDTSIDTGVFLNNMPYIVLVAAAGIALVIFMKNQKHQEQE